MKEKLGTVLKSQMPVTLIFLVLGLFLIFLPIGTLNILCRIFFGLSLICTGVYHIVVQVRKKTTEETNIPSLYSGVVTMVIGLFLFFYPEVVVMLLPWMLGGFVLADCIWMVKEMLALKKKNVDFWRVLAFVILVFAVLAVILILNRFEQKGTMLKFAGGLFVAKAVADFLLPVFQKKKVAEAEALADRTRKAMENAGYPGSPNMAQAAPVRQQAAQNPAAQNSAAAVSGQVHAQGGAGANTVTEGSGANGNTAI